VDHPPSQTEEEAPLAPGGAPPSYQPPLLTPSAPPPSYNDLFGS
jgi:hypothetical protein